MAKDDFNKKNLPRPTPVGPAGQDEKEASLAREANQAFEIETRTMPMFKEPATKLPGVPFDEELDPAKIEEYCQREPWLLTSLERAPYTAEFGFIPERFKYIADKLEAEGDSEGAAPYEEAYKKGQYIYWQQLKKDFRILESKMDRKAIGMYAQTLWTNVTMQVENKGAEIWRFVGRDRYDQMDRQMRELARDAIFANTKWLALNINEIPLSRGTGPKPRPLN